GGEIVEKLLSFQNCYHKFSAVINIWRGFVVVLLWKAMRRSCIAITKCRFRDHHPIRYRPQVRKSLETVHEPCRWRMLETYWSDSRAAGQQRQRASEDQEHHL